MASTVEVTNHTQHKDIHKQFVMDVVHATLVAVAKEIIAKKDLLVTIAVVTPEEIRTVNKRLRNKDAETDIISIGEYDSIAAVAQVDRPVVAIGELIVCYEVIEKSAKIDSVHALHELAFVVSHGVLHILGSEHSEAMFALQDDISKKMVEEYAVYQ